MPSELETAMQSLITVFHRYASKDGKKDGKKDTLSRKELRELMENELSNFLKCQKDPATVDKIMKDLDTNGDGVVSFEEFVSLVVGLSIACEQLYTTSMNKMGKKSIIMTNVQKAMALLIETFDKYASKEGARDTLTKGELKDLLKNEFGDLLGKANDTTAVDRLFQGLDANQDGSVDFNEFTNMVSCLTVMCHQHFCKK
ncbi:protein S100-A10a [Anoplopoma fimbria]|uniref:protein S100-A10a n=1 Tax=Anoplopoma fimbria TaxID=229290 RepID=UPI0023EBF721|nr:protein S100-A10a [Anoplopoma fimbria]